MGKFFTWLGRFEGTSLLILLFIAMPMKYFAGLPQAVKSVGMVHGLLFVAYVIAAFAMSAEEEWEKGKLISCLILSCLPFGTFYFERKYASPLTVQLDR